MNAQIYCDESGFTGSKLLDRAQPYFTYASVSMNAADADELIDRVRKNNKLQKVEFKSSNLLKHERGRRAMTEVIESVAKEARIVAHDKKFALASFIFENGFEPALAANNALFYSINFHRFISGILHALFESKDEPAEALFERFEATMRSLDAEELIGLFSAPDAPDDLVVAEGVVGDIGTFLTCHRARMAEELDTIRKLASARWALDLSMTSLFALLSHWSDRHGSIEVTCDKSKPLRAYQDLLDVFVGRTDRAYSRWSGRSTLMTPNLTRSIQFENSKNVHGLQVADVLAGAAAHIFRVRGQTDADATHWLNIFESCESFGDECIVPTPDAIDLDQEEPFVNALVLKELLDRTLRGESLLAQMEDFIAVARSSFHETTRE